MGQGLWLIFNAILQYKHAYQPVDMVMYELYLWVIIFWRNAGHSKSILKNVPTLRMALDTALIRMQETNKIPDQ